MIVFLFESIFGRCTGHVAVPLFQRRPNGAILLERLVRRVFSKWIDLKSSFFSAIFPWPIPSFTRFYLVLPSFT